MDLYQKVKRKAKGCRIPDVRIKLDLFLLALKLRNVSEACSRRGDIAESWGSAVEGLCDRSL